MKHKNASYKFTDVAQNAGTCYNSGHNKPNGLRPIISTRVNCTVFSWNSTERERE
ncbi:hypothetical protein ARMGADRAFT_1010030 [Armillaria gallica]|uniref:Uncharacterized protein n=1 Tax=Armillaria gallica TaxID=47427 RepID=A0A2H3DR61_ARMGA|nr:hypothetical protein ARMGADRAFT_1010030 [Armillaria gallica]